MEKDKKLMLFLPPELHKRIKVQSAKTEKSMNLIILEILREKIK
jgi:predicted HicB family RNase H-like nuclease